MKTNYYQQIVDLVKEVSGQKNIIGIPKIYIKATGDLARGAFLSQVVFWSDQSKRADGFFYRTAKDWEDELSLSYDQVTRISKTLEGQGLIERKLMKAEGIPTMHYRPIMDKIVVLILEKLENRKTLNSENPQTDIQETRKSLEIRESRISITEREKTTEIDSTPSKKSSKKLDPLTHIVETAKNGISSTSGPNPEDQWILYGKEFEQIYKRLSGSTLTEAERIAISKISGADGANPQVWEDSIVAAFTNWTGNGKPSLDRMIEIYTHAQGDFDRFSAWKWPKTPGKEEQPQEKPYTPPTFQTKGNAGAAPFNLEAYRELQRQQQQQID